MNPYVRGAAPSPSAKQLYSSPCHSAPWQLSSTCGHQVRSHMLYVKELSDFQRPSAEVHLYIVLVGNTEGSRPRASPKLTLKGKFKNDIKGSLTLAVKSSDFGRGRMAGPCYSVVIKDWPFFATAQK